MKYNNIFECLIFIIAYAETNNNNITCFILKGCRIYLYSKKCIVIV